MILNLGNPFSCIVSGSSVPGKSSFCIHFIQKIDYLCTERKFGGGIDWCYDEKKAISPHQQLPANICFNQGVPDEFVTHTAIIAS